ncbi:MAG: HAMP domain-containing protein [Clostridium sp.]|nr:HAMP domain-containing protein [Clostridium sp.]
MKYSIRYRFTLIFIGLMTLVLLAVLAVNTWCLEPFYINQKVKVMESAYDLVDAAVMEQMGQGGRIVDLLEAAVEAQRKQDAAMDWGRKSWQRNGELKIPETEVEESTENSEELSEAMLMLYKIRELGEKNNAAIVMIDSSTGKAFLSAGRESEWLALKVQRYILGQNKNGSETVAQHENYTIEKTYDPRSNALNLESWGFFSDNSTMFILSIPLAGIRDSVRLSNMFLTYVGIVVLIIGSLLMYATTRKITSPILALSALSEKMSHLDFEAKYEGKAEDEIGVLGRSMNTLSDKLKDTIGELKTANNELQRDIEEKIRIDETRKDFIANVSHELKTPIALIQGYAEGLTEGMAEDADSRDYYCEVIMDEANKMNTMVKQLLNLTALEFGNDMPVMEAFNITGLIQGILTSAGILLQQKEAEAVFLQKEPVWVWADEFKIEEVITNYLNNAMNHLEGERRIEIRLEQVEGEVKVTVFNTGQPIPEEDLGNLWTKFYKVDKARTRSYGGSGIGLSIVKAIMDSHNKTCGVKNVEGGVEFWFTLDSSM